MNCPNCGFQGASQNALCPHCGVDQIVFLKTQKSSIRLYNKGLAAANANEYQVALSHLQESLLFDKGNINARNLLGLLYFHAGYVGDALKEWIVSISLQEENNLASYYLDVIQKNPKGIEKYNDAVCFYNQALEYLKQGSDDLAMIQLKRAVDSNENLLDARNLLALCSIAANQLSDAEYHIRQVLKKDPKNITALGYAQKLSLTILTKANKKTAKAEVEQPRPTVQTPIQQRQSRPKGFLGKREVASFFLGICITAGAVGLSFLPQFQEVKMTLLGNDRAARVLANGTPSMSDAEVSRLQQELTYLKSENTQLKEKAELYENMELLNHGEELVAAENFQAAADALFSMDTKNFTPEALEKYDTLKAGCYPKAASLYYNEGKAQYLNQELDSAKGNLESAMKYDQTSDVADDTLYYLGKIAQEKGDKNTAVTYFNQLLDSFPDSNQAANARNQLALLTGASAE